MYVVNFPAQTSEATFNPIIQVLDFDAGEPFDLSDVSICFEIKDGADCAIIRATKDNGMIVLISDDDGVNSFFQPVFPNLSQLSDGTYRIHCSIARDGVTRDLMLGSLPIVRP